MVGEDDKPSGNRPIYGRVSAKARDRSALRFPSDERPIPLILGNIECPPKASPYCDASIEK
jgi:hypothetical protein